MIKILGAVAAVLYPLLVLWVLSAYREHLRTICLVVLPVLAVVCIVQWGKERKAMSALNPLIALFLFVAVAATDAPQFFKLYPILVSSLLLMHFGASLVNPPTVVHQLALLSRRGKALPPEAIKYCRKVTWLWVGFFCFNIAVSAGTALSGSWLVWTWYNGFISYLIMGMLMGGEWLVRRRVQQVG